MIPDETIAEVLDRVDLVALVGRHVDLRKAGTVFKGLCPFHSERSPSFVVTPTRRTYHCFGCGVHGDALRFVREIEGRSFLEAIRELAAGVGVALPESRPESPAVKAERARQRTLEERLLAIQDQLAARYSEELFGPGGTRARAYLRERGINRRAAAAFRLGWASGDKLAFAQWAEVRNIALDDLVTLGLVVPPDEGLKPSVPLGGGRLRFRDRVIFPVVDIRGEVVGFGGRILEADAKVAKYINSPETPVYTKGAQLYGAYTARYAARRGGRAVLVEGNVDVVMAWQAGLEGTVAAMGTALTARQVRLLKRLSEQVVCVMDGDAAGRKAAFSSLPVFLEEGVHPRAVTLPDGEDPDSFLRRNGPKALQSRLDTARPLLELFIEEMAQRHPNDPSGRAVALRELAPLLGRLGDAVEKALYRERACRALGVPAEVMDTALQAALEPRPGPRRAAPAPEPPPFDVPPPEAVPEAAPEWAPGGRPDPFSAVMEVFEAPARRAPARPPARVPPLELEAVDLILQYPAHAIGFQDRGGIETLTHPGLAAFVARLCDAVRAGRTPNEDRLLMTLDDDSLAAVLVERIARRPTQTEESVLAALDQACRKLRRSWLMRRRTEIARQLEAAWSSEGRSRINGELALIQNELMLLRVEGTS